MNKNNTILDKQGFFECNYSSGFGVPYDRCRELLLKGTEINFRENITEIDNNININE